MGIQITYNFDFLERVSEGGDNNSWLFLIVLLNSLIS